MNHRMIRARLDRFDLFIAVLKGHAFRRAAKGKKNSALAAEVVAPSAPKGGIDFAFDRRS